MSAQGNHPLRPPFAPMEARQLAEIPTGEGWQYEPKWDGFRCLAFRAGEDVALQSKAGQPLARYFPEIVAALAGLRADGFVLDGELVVPSGDALDFDALLGRIHPADSRVQRLALETPAVLIAYDLLADEHAVPLIDRPLHERRALLERFAARFLTGERVRLSPQTRDLAVVQAWFAGAGGALDGVIAKQVDEPYRSGERAVVKVKQVRTADCVVGGFRYGAGAHSVGSLLLGLYDGAGLLHHVGFTSGFSSAEKTALVARLQPLIAPPGFTGNTPAGPSRWQRGRSEVWHPLAPSLVLEVAYDHAAGGRFRHGTRPLRWRPDKAARDCTTDQLRAIDRTWSVVA